MSGSGSGGGYGSGGGGQSIDCSTLSFETIISSPVPEQIQQIDVGDDLGIILTRLGSTEIVQVMNDDQVVGGLVDKAPLIKECLDSGFGFAATVRSISGAAVKIFVYPA